MEEHKKADRQKKELERRFRLKDDAEPSGDDATGGGAAGGRDPDKHSDDEAGSDVDDEDRLREEEVAGLLLTTAPTPPATLAPIDPEHYSSAFFLPSGLFNLSVLSLNLLRGFAKMVCLKLLYPPERIQQGTEKPPSRMPPGELHSGTLSCAGFGEVEKRVRTTGGGASGSVRNLRIREDTAKYLLNLDPESAYYDPKSRCRSHS